MNWRAGAEPRIGEPLSDDPWPVAEKKLLTVRESSLYQMLLGLYPDDKLFIQVALSQLIEVDRKHPDRHSIRSRYKQLVADFVLCRADLSVVAVIELDDRTHEWPKRKAADARKNKALSDAGIRLVRIPAGRIPSEADLRALIDGDGRAEEDVQEETVLSLAGPVEIYPEQSSHRWHDSASAESREMKRILLKATALVVLVVGGWVIFSQVLPAAIKQALQPLAVPRVRAEASPRISRSAMPQQSFEPTVVTKTTAAELAALKQQALQATTATQNEKNLAWAAFYSAPASCGHPADWTAQVECGNQHMRAKKVFDQKWNSQHPSSSGGAQQIVLDNRSVVGSRK